ncbi:DUF5709 domain-containing protein [Streptacidiphilus sp. MAP12-16]|uniref:DUF5709 domain-containing protein n=1 Tax=Streptacidiphilus sp. MAP12-16 TaxID=3156300 RepID=UPI0035128F0D
MSDDMTGDGVYQPDGSEVQDDEGILDAEDTLDDRAAGALDEGYSPPERAWAVEGPGVTGAEQYQGESLQTRLDHELPDVRAFAGDGLGDTVDTDGELWDSEVGVRRTGRLAAHRQEDYPSSEQDLTAEDVGIDGGAASAEEAAMHLIPEGEDDDAL